MIEIDPKDALTVLKTSAKVLALLWLICMGLIVRSCMEMRAVHIQDEILIERLTHKYLTPCPEASTTKAPTSKS